MSFIDWLPVAVVNGLNGAEAGCHDQACRIVAALDERGLLTDQMAIDTDEDDGSVAFAWPFLGLYLEFRPPSEGEPSVQYWVHDVRGDTGRRRVEDVDEALRVVGEALWRHGVQNDFYDTNRLEAHKYEI